MKSHTKTSRKAIVTVLLSVVFLAGCAAQTTYLRLDPSLQRDIVSMSGYQYLPLSRLCDTYGMNCVWDTYARTATVRKGSDTIVLHSGSEIALVNGSARRIERPVVVTGGAVYVPVNFARAELVPAPSYARTIPVRPIVTVEEQPAKFSIRTVVLDTGHGGKDVGAMGKAYGSREKDLALQLSRKIKAILEREGLRVVMTRSDDTFIPLPKRAQIANQSGADIFVSVHVNASRSRLMRGFECYYLSNATDDNSRALEAFEDSSLKLSESADAERSSQLDKTLWDMALTENRMESAELASYICESVDQSSVIRSRGVRTARFYVLKHTRLPSVLVEAGYISNSSEEAKMRDGAFLDRLAEVIAKGILRYKKRFEQTEGFTNV